MALRDDIVANALWGVANEKSIHYQQSRPIDGLGDPRKLPLQIDCSGFATACYAWAGAPDPNGNDYNGQGFTGTLLTHLESIDPTDCQPGDLIVFGPGVGDHVVIAIEAGSNPMCVSHGQERGPVAIRLDAEAAAHRPPVTFLRGKGLDHSPRPDVARQEAEMPAPATVELPDGNVVSVVRGADHRTYFYTDAVNVFSPLPGAWSSGPSLTATSTQLIVRGVGIDGALYETRLSLNDRAPTWSAPQPLGGKAG